MRSMYAESNAHVLMTIDTVGGVWHQGLQLAAGLVQRGMRVSLATMGALLSPAQRAQAARVRGVQIHESRWRLEWMDDARDDVSRAGDWLLGLEARLRPDVVHLNQFAFGACPFVAPKLVVAHSCVLSWWRAVHSERAPSSWDDYRRTVRLGLAGATLVGAPTQAMLDALAVEHGHVHGGVVLPNGRSPADFRPGDKQPVILAAGRLWDPAKNLAALEAVAPRLPWPVRVAGARVEPGRMTSSNAAAAPAPRARLPWPVRVAGARVEPGRMTSSNAAAAPASFVQWLGELAQAELAAQFAEASIYALPARYEPFGLSALEAALSGCALVLGDVPSLREVWGDAAAYVPPGNTGALREALIQLIDDPQQRAQMAHRARMRARCFTPSRMVEAYLGAYARLCAPKHAVDDAAIPVPVQRQPEAIPCGS
jgi:glycogen(starch) synthase